MGKDMQRALLWAILFTSCFLLWDNYQVYKGEKSFFHTEAVEQQAAADAASSVPTGKDIDATVPSAVAVKDPVVVETDRMKVTFDREGAVIVGTEMTLIPRQADWTEVGLAGLILDRKPAENLGNVDLLEITKNRTYVAQSGLVGGNFPNHKDQYKLVSQKLSMGDADKLDVVFEATKGGVTVKKTYTFNRGHYGIDVSTEVVNNSGAAIQPSAYYQLTRDGGKPEGESSMYSTYTGPAFYSDEEKFQKLEFGDIADNSASFEKFTNNGWLAMVQHHFVSAWVPANGEERENYAREVSKNLYSVGTLVKLGTIESGKSVTDKAVLYSGPQDQDRLEQIAPGLELVVDYGWLTKSAARPPFPKKADLLAPVLPLRHCRQLGLGHRASDLHREGDPLSGFGRRLSFDGPHEGSHAAHEAAAGSLQGRQAAPQPGHDGALPHGKDQSGRRLPPDHAADSRVPRALLGASGFR